MIQDKINKLQSSSSSSTTTIACPLCHKNINLIIDQDARELICINCGCVVSRNSLDPTTDMDFISKYDTDSKILSNDIDSCNSTSLPQLALYKGLSTIIGKTNRDVRGHQIDTNMINNINRLRKCNTWSQIQNTKERNLYFAFIQLQRLNDILSLHHLVIEKAVYIYSKIRQRKRTNGVSIKLVIVSALYIACREMDIPRTLKEISGISNIDEKKSSRFYRKMILELDFKVPQTDPQKAVIKISNICKTSERAKRYALKMMSTIIRMKPFNSKNPMGLAGAIVYLSCKKNGDHIIQYQIANATGITLTTLRRDLRFLENIIK